MESSTNIYLDWQSLRVSSGYDDNIVYYSLDLEYREYLILDRVL